MDQETLVFPVSLTEQRLWLLDQMSPGSPAYNMPIGLQLTGTLDAAALHTSLKEIVRRHDSLRTTFTTVEGTPFQVIRPPSQLPLPLVDLRTKPPEEREAELDRLLDVESRTPFDLAKGPLFRAMLIRIDD